MFWIGFAVGFVSFTAAVFLLTWAMCAYFERQDELQFHEDLRGY